MDTNELASGTHFDIHFTNFTTWSKQNQHDDTLFQNCKNNSLWL